MSSSSKIQLLRWEYVNDDCIELPDAKTGGRVVPLGPEAHAVLADLPREDGNGILVPIQRIRAARRLFGQCAR